MMTTTHVYRGFVFTITCRVEEPDYIVRYADIPEIIRASALTDMTNSFETGDHYGRSSDQHR